MRNTLTAGLAALALSACTTQLSSLAPPAGQGTEPVTGVSYRLARLDYTLTVTRTLARCPEPGKSPLEVEVAAVAVPTYGPSEEVMIDYAALANGWKTTSVALETFPNGVLKSVNAQVSDQTGPAVKAGVSSLVGIAKLALGVPGIPQGAAAHAAAQGEGFRGILQCTDLAKTLLETLKTLDARRDATAKARDAAKAELDAFDADHAGSTLTDAAKAQRAALATKSRTAADAAKEAADASAKQRLQLSVQTTRTLATDAPGSSSLRPDATAGGALFAKLLQVLVTKDGVPVGPPMPVPASLDFGSSTGTDVAAQGALRGLIDRATAQVDFRPTGSALAATVVASAAACGPGKGRSPCGVLYRSVTPARLQVCRYSEQLVECGTRPAGDPYVLIRDERNAPQLGGLRSLPLRNGPFETNSLVAVFREDSSLSTVAYAKPTAGGVAAIGALGDVVTGATEVDSFARGRNLRRQGNQTARSKAETDLATAQAAAIEAELKRREAQAKLDALNEVAGGEDQ
ncbi:hypothetical protein ACVOMT_15605 [Sphingomonas panni]